MIKNLINSQKFNFSFFLSDRKKVKSLETGAMKHGGATQYNTGIYSNIEGNDFIKVNSSNNTISIFIPSTLDVNKQTDNTEYIQYANNYLKRFYINKDIIYYKTLGSWYSDDNKQVVKEDITIMSINLVTVTETDIQIFIDLANYIKKAMNQEGVSISINSALAII